MRYISPVTLFGKAFQPPLDPKTIQRERKKWLAELELSPDGRLQLKHRWVDKNELLEYFETLENPTTVDYHEVVSKDDSLAEFLESQRLSAGGRFASFREYDDPGFLQWISPYYYAAFTAYARACLEINDEQGMRNLLLRNRLFLTDKDRTRAWTNIGQILENNISRLEHYYKVESVNAHYDEIDHLASPEYTRMILLFPPKLFSQWRDQLAFSIMQVAIVYFNKNKWNRSKEIAQTWIESARELAVSKNMVSTVNQKLREMGNLREKKRKAISVRALIVLVVIAGKFLIPTHNNFYDNVNPNGNQITLDSFMRAHPEHFVHLSTDSSQPHATPPIMH